MRTALLMLIHTRGFQQQTGCRMVYENWTVEANTH